MVGYIQCIKTCMPEAGPGEMGLYLCVCTLCGNVALLALVLINSALFMLDTHLVSFSCNAIPLCRAPHKFSILRQFVAESGLGV